MYSFQGAKVLDKKGGKYNMNEQVVNLTFFLIKDYIQDFKDCMKSPNKLSSAVVKPSLGMER